MGRAQLDQEHGTVRAGVRDQAAVHVASVCRGAHGGHREFYGFGYGCCPGGLTRSVDWVDHDFDLFMREAEEDSMIVVIDPLFDAEANPIAGFRMVNFKKQIAQAQDRASGKAQD